MNNLSAQEVAYLTESSESIHLSLAETDPVKLRELIIWCLDSLITIFVRDGKFRKPGILAFFKLLPFCIELLRKIAQMIRAKKQPIEVQH